MVVEIVEVAAEVVVVEDVVDNQQLKELPELGVGLGYRANLRSEIFFHQDKIDFLEIIAEHYIDMTPEKESELELLKNHFILIPHAINLSLGTAETIDQEYLIKLAKLIKYLNPPWWSEHICFTKAGGIDIGHLSPLPFTNEAIDVVCNNIAQIKKIIDTPLILENISYLLTLPGQEMDESEFISRILEKSDCGLLLDVANVYINSVNLNYDPITFLKNLPLERVIQLHFAGGHWYKSVLIDSHSQNTPDEIWDLMKKTIELCNPRGIILERDENFPEFCELLNEINHARKIKLSTKQCV
ncbi:MAG: DUF692 domain-containing protein [Candidatus Sericytochromatia bacterium]|nr:DUF692 domain-containing protein [Candidatus Sericytochromatia bacterium]